MKQTLTTVMGEAEAVDLVRRLAANHVVAERTPQTDEQGNTPDVFAILVSDEDYDRALLLLADAVPGSLKSGQDDAIDRSSADEPILSSVTCPPCGQRRVAVVDGLAGCRLLALLFVSVPLLGIPAVVWFYRERRHGSKKHCLACRHVWRSRP